MNGHIVIIRTGQQAWHVRQVAHGRIIMWSENYRRKVGAERAILSAARDWGHGRCLLKPNSRNEIVSATSGVLGMTVRYEDERVAS